MKGPFTRKNGSRYFEIAVSRGRGNSPYLTRWDVPEGLAAKTVMSRLNIFVVEFEKDCHDGKILNRAQKKELEKQAEKQTDESKTFRGYCDKVFMPDIAVRCSENTRYNYELQLNTRLFPAFGEKALSDITSGDINSYLRGLQGDDCAHSTLIKQYTILRSVFGMAFDDDLIPTNPMFKVKRPKKRKKEAVEAEPKAFSAEEISKILKCLKEEPFQWQVLVRLLIDSGARIGEITGLLWKNVDFDKETIRIDGSLTYSSAKGVMRTTTKNGKSREFKVASDIIQMMKILKQQQDYSVASPYVFTQSKSDKPIHPQSPLRYLKKFGEKYGIEDMHPHKFRHSYASLAISNGADVLSVSAKLGHSDVAVTLRNYSHANQEGIEKAAEIFRNAIK